MKLTILILISCVPGFFSCHKSNSVEDPSIAARIFCDCVNGKLKDAKDSSVNINECNIEFDKSRLMRIYIDNNTDSFSRATLDSANGFSMKVFDVIDTMCLKKIEKRKLKKRTPVILD